LKKSQSYGAFKSNIYEYTCALSIYIYDGHCIQILQSTVHDLGYADADGRAVRSLGGNPVEWLLRVLPVSTDDSAELDMAGQQCCTSVRKQTIYQVSIYYSIRSSLVY